MRTRGTVLAVGLSVAAFTSCKTPANNAASLKDARPAGGGATGDAADNRSEQGGLRGSADNGKTFKIKGDYPDTPDFLTAPPPVPDMDVIRLGPKDARAVAAAKDWMQKIADYIYDDTAPFEFVDATDGEDLRIAWSGETPVFAPFPLHLYGMTSRRLAVRDGTIGFATPLATLHAFNGWADMFLTTPANGLKDLYLRAAYSLPADFVGARTLALNATWHDFKTDSLDTGIGAEWDASAELTVNTNLSLLLKYAEYQGAGAAAGSRRCAERCRFPGTAWHRGSRVRARWHRRAEPTPDRCGRRARPDRNPRCRTCFRPAPAAVRA